MKTFEQYDVDPKWLKKWPVIDLLDLVKEISGNNLHKHPVQEEWQYCIENRSMGNDKAFLEWLNNENIPIITSYLIENYGFKEKNKVMFWVCW